MSDYMEIINPQTRIARLYFNGEVIQEYKVEPIGQIVQLMAHPNPLPLMMN